MSKKKSPTAATTEAKSPVPMIAGRRAKQKASKAAAFKAAPTTADESKVKMSTLTKSKATKKSGKLRGRSGLSGLDAAAKVLADAGKPLTSQEMIEAMFGKGLWKSSGKTPHATIYAAIIREIVKKGSASRFRKTDRGHFTVAAHAKGAK